MTLGWVSVLRNYLLGGGIIYLLVEGSSSENKNRPVGSTILARIFVLGIEHPHGHAYLKLPGRSQSPS